jgi:ribonuclease HII
VVLLAADTKPAPLGVADSKLLTPQARQRLVPRIRRWALDCAVGHSSAAEIDRIGIIAALRLAAERAVTQLVAAPDWVLLDGNHNYLSLPVEPGLFDVAEAEPTRWRCQVPVRTLIKGDLKCSSIAAASVLAKTERDSILIGLAQEYPQYGFEDNKAYSSPQHHAALLTHGPSAIHRCSWNLPGLAEWPGLPHGSEPLPGAEVLPGAEPLSGAEVLPQGYQQLEAAELPGQPVGCDGGTAGIARTGGRAERQVRTERQPGAGRQAATGRPARAARLAPAAAETSDLPSGLTTGPQMGDDEQMIFHGSLR